MPLPSKEEIRNRLENLSEELRSALSDEGINNAMQQITGRNNLSAEREKGVIRLTGYVLIGLLHPEDLAKEMQEELHFNHQAAKSLSEEITRDVINPTLTGSISPAVTTTQPPSESPAAPASKYDADLLSPAFKEKKYHEESVRVSEEVVAEEPAPQPSVPPTPQPQVQPPPQQAEAETPSPTPQGESAPFVLHEETKIQPLASSKTIPLSRPQFFKSTAEEKPRAAPSTARLEIGADTAPKTQQAGQTKKEMPRVVNYTSPVTKVDPFERPKAKEEPAPETKEEKPLEEAPPKEVSPDNIVNLKDLPR